MTAIDASSFADDLCGFLDSCPTSFHAADTSLARLERHGFRLLFEDDPWDVSAGRWAVVREGAFIAFSIPSNWTAGKHMPLRIIGAHTDSPAFKVKPSAVSAEPFGHAQVDVEVYGGMLQSSWLNREMGIAGVLVDRSGQRHLVSTDGPAMIIPQLAIHLDRSQNAALSLSAQQHLHPIAALPGQEFDLLGLLARSAGLKDAQEIDGFELYSYDAAPARRFGPDSLMIASARQDNLVSVFSALHAIENCANESCISMIACFDHEEVGSQTRSGAAGSFLEDVIERLSAGTMRQVALASSLCLSVDVSHALNPNFAAKHDPQTYPVMGGGPVLKFNANQRYPTDARGQAAWKRACRAAGVEGQSFVSNNDSTCGSTIAPMIASRLGITALDAGVPIWSMHSAREVSHAQDSAAMAAVMTAFLSE